MDDGAAAGSVRHAAAAIPRAGAQGIRRGAGRRRGRPQAAAVGRAARLEYDLSDDGRGRAYRVATRDARALR